MIFIHQNKETLPSSLDLSAHQYTYILYNNLNFILFYSIVWTFFIFLYST